MQTIISPRSPNPWQYLHPFQLSHGLWRHRSLIHQLVQRDIANQYNNSLLGVLWSLINPLILLAIYTLVFSVILKTRWPGDRGETAGQFALIAFTGLLVFNILSESIARSTMLIVSTPNYVKKTVFPLEVLPVSTIAVVLFEAAARLIVLLAAMLAIGTGLHWTLILLPLVLLPVVLLSLGCAWFFASLGVFLRDIGQSIGLLIQVLFFATPILYPAEAIPEPWAWVIRLNPLTGIVDAVRQVVLWGALPDWPMVGVSLAGTALVALLGYTWFMTTKSAFADVL